MNKKILILVLTLILCIQSMGITVIHAEEIPEDCETIEFDKKYWAEPDEVRWFKFEAPAPQCSFSDMQIEQIGDYLYGRDVASHRYYDSEGNELGTISSTNDPDVSDWTEFEVGETYYIKVMADSKEGAFFTLSPVRTVEPSAKSSEEGYKGKKTLTLTEEDVEKFFMGNTNTNWDVYTITEEFTVGSENVITSSDFFILPYKVCFDESQLSVDKRTTTYSVADYTAQTHWDSLTSFVKKPYTDKANIMESGFAQAANHYAYVMDGEGSVKAERSYKVYVPTGKRIKLAEDGCFYPLAINERFSDISINAWYTDAISETVENKFMNGMSGTEFSPATALTRAQFVMILANIENADLSKYGGRQSFGDVPQRRWYHLAVEWAKESGVTSGVSERNFAPEDKVTRQQLARFLCTYAELKGIDMPDGVSLEGFADANKVADWAKPSVEKVVAAGIINGMTPTTLDPRGNATRAQIAVMINIFNNKFVLPIKQSAENGNYLLEGGSCGYSYYEELLNLAGKDDPHILYIGMACTDPADGYDGIKGSMANWSDKCTFDLLLLEDLATDTAKEKIESADIIYVTGGSSRMLLERLRRYGTDALIRKAAAEGTVMSGSSAGAICFGAYGASSIHDNRFENLYGTGCVNIIICPHGEEQTRIEEMKRLILKDATLTGVAVDYSALEIRGGKFRVFTEEGYHKTPTAIRYWNEDGEIKSEDINSINWRDLKELGA